MTDPGAPGDLAGAAVARAQADAARSLPNDRDAAEPCATCPPPPTPDLELDGALIGRGCRAMSNPRALGRLAARSQVVGYTATRTGRTPIIRENPDDAAVTRKPVGRQELAAAFSRENVYRADSPCCKTARERSGERAIVYVNGIQNRLSDHCETLRRLAEATCANVIGVYNATESMIGDLDQSRVDRDLIEAAAAGKPFAVGDRRNPAVDTMADVMVIERLTPGIAGDAKVEYWAHSQGGAITSLAVSDANRTLATRRVRQSMSGVHITTINSAAPQWVDGPEYTHYVHQGDYVGMRLGIGEAHGDPAYAGSGATVIEFSDRDASQPARWVDGRYPLVPAVGEDRFVWRELRDGKPTGMGRGMPGMDASNKRPWDSTHHGMNDNGLRMYRERQLAIGARVCPEPASAQPVPTSTSTSSAKRAAGR